MALALTVNDLAFGSPAPAPAPAAHPAVELLMREEATLRGVMKRYVRDAASVDDVFQEVSLKVLRHFAAVRDPQALRGWLFQLARNACLDHLRREARRIGGGGEAALEECSAPGDLGRTPVASLLTAERLTAIRKALDELPKSQREVIRLRIEEGLDHEAIATRLGISRPAVEVRLCKGRATLAGRLADILDGGL